MSDVAVAILRLPNGKAVYQRRDHDTPVEPGNLSFFGGKVESGESPDDAIRRELAEETSLTVPMLDLRKLKAYPRPGAKDDSYLHLYICNIETADFDVYEGKGAEVYEPSTLILREDVAPGTRIGTTYYLREQTDV